MKHSFLKGLSVGIVSMSVALAVSADSFTYPTLEDERSGGLTFTPMIGNLNLDDGRDVDSDTIVGFGIGYRFVDPYMVEFVYASGDAETKAGADIGDLRQYRLEMLYDIGDVGNFSPYIALGAASTEFGNNATVVDDEGAISAGFGARYHFTDRIALRGDARYLRGVGDTKGADAYLGLALQIFLGNTSKPEPEPIKTVAFVEPELPSFADRCRSAGGVVNADRCVKNSVSTDKVTLNVEFASNSDTVQATYIPEIGRLADFMKQYPSATAVIGGHTDSIGSAEYNQSLSQRRVNEVVRLLSANYGIEGSRLSAIGYGESQPIASNDTAEGRADNRRVEASITVEVEETLQVDVK
ncbi:OmpA family protein [Eionea flava]